MGTNPLRSDSPRLHSSFNSMQPWEQFGLGKWGHIFSHLLWDTQGILSLTLILFSMPFLFELKVGEDYLHPTTHIWKAVAGWVWVKEAWFWRGSLFPNPLPVVSSRPAPGCRPLSQPPPFQNHPFPGINIFQSTCFWIPQPQETGRRIWTEMVLRCSQSLEHLSINYFLPLGWK